MKYLWTGPWYLTPVTVMQNGAWRTRRQWQRDYRGDCAPWRRTYFGPVV
jgi:hypothetical protein